MKIGGRSVRVIAGALFERRHYSAAVNMLRLYERPVSMLRRYLFSGGSYPVRIGVHTPTGMVYLTAFCRDDILTINEIFCREDYMSTGSDRVIVDFGSNIGISAAYFLSRNNDAFAYLYEPLPQNIEKLRKNLEAFEGRYSVAQHAVGGVDGDVEFGWEETGRYGGLGVRTGQYIQVKCRRSGEIISHILAIHEHIDILKIDIERQEEVVIDDIAVGDMRRITKVYVEKNFAKNPLAETHRYSQRGPIAQFVWLLPAAG